MSKMKKKKKKFKIQKNKNKNQSDKSAKNFAKDTNVSNKSAK